LFDLRDEMIFLGVSIFGQIIRIVTVGFAAKNTSGRNQAAGQIADEINTTGIYSIVRHPLYVGNFFMWLGPVLFLRSVWFAVVFALVYWLYYERIMFAEEQFLRRKFGEAYDKWSAKVGAFVPFHIKFVRPGIPFSVRNVLKNEYNGFANIFIIFTLLDLFRNFTLTGKIQLTEIWMWLMIGVAGFWIMIRIIHKLTRWLET